MEQSNKYYKSHAVGVTSEVGLTTDRDLSELSLSLLLLYFRDTGSHVLRASVQHIVNSKRYNK